jgi:hypothetical protein
MKRFWAPRWQAILRGQVRLPTQNGIKQWHLVLDFHAISEKDF